MCTPIKKMPRSLCAFACKQFVCLSLPAGSHLQPLSEGIVSTNNADCKVRKPKTKARAQISQVNTFYNQIFSFAAFCACTSEALGICIL